MKWKIAGLLVITFISGCAPSEAKVATAIAETEAARPTDTSTPTQTSSPTSTIKPTITFTPTSTPAPTQTERPTVFQLTFAETKSYLIGEELSGPTQVTCMLKNTPVWVACDSFTYFYKDELSQFVEVLHDGESVVGLIIVFNHAVMTKYPDEVTTAFGTLSFGLDFGLPLTIGVQVPDYPRHVRVEDFVLSETREGDLSAYIYLDLQVAEEIF